jgi:hypothetical protein
VVNRENQAIFNGFIIHASLTVFGKKKLDIDQLCKLGLGAKYERMIHDLGLQKDTSLLQ